MMSASESRWEFQRWLRRCIEDGQVRLNLNNADIIVLLNEELSQRVTIEYAERIRKTEAPAKPD